ncbi:hypothetical protein SG34_002610 [Thalassomonas viridans]|uniref:Lipoprotein n=1 Tax=Thalassomonas viridans TaxID=137584 RepID=A0AAE9Z3B6_9GAMM|nr:hypothetical protein [Thalassomonas viridans]WDE05845.1 hypothetical protein SG34_002610 [Thalassomonas viridans]
MFMNNKSRAFKVLATLGCAAILALSGCKSTPNTTRVGPLVVGPSVQPALGSVKRTYSYNSDIYLDVVVPVFNPGLPLTERGEVDYDQVDEQGIWPQLRRAEAKRFAVQTKKALENIGTFGSVSVVPSPNASGDVFVLGSVDYSDSEIVKITATVIDSSGDIWGTKQFEHTVSKGFFRDELNKDKNPYEPVFTRIGDYVYDLLKKRSEAEKQNIKDTTEVRYAQVYSPESFNKYIETTLVKGRKPEPDHYEYKLTGLPSEDDRMMQRLMAIKAQDQMFVDRLQDQYLAFDEKTLEAYRNWQKETLPEVIAAKETESDRTKSALLGGVLAVGAVLLSKNSDSGLGEIGKYAAGIGAAYFIKDSLDKNAELKVHKETLDEAGGNLDMALSPSVIELDDNLVELSGTAGEQYEQWKAHLRKIYQLEYASETLP